MYFFGVFYALIINAIFFGRKSLIFPFSKVCFTPNKSLLRFV